MLVLGLAVSVRVSGFRARFRVKVRAGFETPGYETPGTKRLGYDMYGSRKTHLQSDLLCVELDR